MDSTPQQTQAPSQPILRQKFDNVSLLFLILTLLIVMVVSSKLSLTDEVRSWLMQITTTVVGAYIGLTQGGSRQPWNPTPANGTTAAIAIKPGETAVVDNTTPPATTTKV